MKTLIMGLVLAAALGFTSAPLLAEEATATKDIVAETLKAGKPTIAEFGAGTCFTCKEMNKVLAQLEAEHGDKVAVAHVSVIDQPDYARGYGVMLIPTQIFFDKTGQEIGRHMGPLTGQEILDSLGVDAEEAKPTDKEKS